MINVDSVVEQTLGLAHDEVLYVVESAVNGVVEKLTENGWIDVSTPPDTASPAALLALLQRRTFTASDALRWRSTSAGGQGNTFDVPGWHANASAGTTQVSMVAATAHASDAAAMAATLNGAIQGSGPDVRGSGLTDRTQAYTAAPGYGAIIRNFNDGQPVGNQSYVASALIHNDINVPNMVFPYGGDDAAGNYQGTNILGNFVANSVMGQWTTPTLVGVYNLDSHAAVNIDPWYFASQQAGHSSTLTSIVNAKHPHWGWGVFYGHDANAEKRAFPVFQTWNNGEPVLNSYAYDAPYGWQPEPNTSPVFEPASDKYGATDKYVGNPGAYFDTAQSRSDWQGGPPFGAGAGIHVGLDYATIQEARDKKKDLSNYFDNKNSMSTHTFGHQFNTWKHGPYPDYHNGVTGYWGEVNYDLKGSDHAWKGLMDALSNGKHYWTHPNTQWIPDLLLPWTNNIKDMINITTALYVARGEVNGWTPPDNVYWGWNEVPIPKEYQEPKQGGGTWWSGFAFVLPE